MPVLIPHVDPLTDPHWNTRLLNTPQASIFHTTHWLRVLQESYNYKPYYFASWQEAQPALLLPFIEVKSWLTGRRGVAVPFADYCDPLIPQTPTFQDVLASVMPTARQRQWKFLEIRGGEAWLCDVSPYTFYDRHVVFLHEDTQEIFSKLRSNYRTKIRQVRQSALRISLLHSAEAMTEYYRLHCLTRQRQGLPPQPAIFFQKIHEHLIANQCGFVTLVSYQGRHIAGAVFFTFGLRAMYKFGASDIRYQHLHPNYGLFWHVLQWLCHNHYTELCFGRTDPGNTGLNQFKSGWGAKKSRIAYYRYDLKNASFVQRSQPAGRVGAAFCKKMPLPLLKLAASVLYKHIG